jgi:hypothetical protein
MKKVKSQKNLSKAFVFKDFVRAVLDIKNNVQVTKRYSKNKLIANANAYDTVGASDKMEYIQYNANKKVVIKKDPITGERKEIPFTKEQEEKFKKTGML